MPLTSSPRKPITLKFKLRLKVLKTKLTERLRSQVKEKLKSQRREIVKPLIKKRVKNLKIKKMLILPDLKKTPLW
jgi:hypothetical protein